MARTPDGREPRSEWIRVRTTPTGKTLLNRLRGSISESNYVRALIEAEAKRKGLKS